VASLLQKYENAVIHSKTTEAVYVELTKKLPQDILEAWRSDEERAMSLRGEALDIYRPRIIESKTIIKILSVVTNSLEPGFAEIRLSWHEKSPSGKAGLLKWLCNGMTMEDEL
jgi:hypothetical protein